MCPDALKKLTLRKCTAPPLTFDFLRVKSYAGTESTGEVAIESLGVDLSQMKGRHLLLCEDIIDTGSTMLKLIPYLESFGPASVKVPPSCSSRRTDCAEPSPVCSVLLGGAVAPLTLVLLRVGTICC